MKYEITVEQFIERYWQDEFNTLFEYITFISIYLSEKDRCFKEIKTEVFNKKGDTFEVWNFIELKIRLWTLSN